MNKMVLFQARAFPLLTSPIEFRQVIQTSLRGGVLIDCAKCLGTQNEMISKFLEEQLSMKPIVVTDCLVGQRGKDT